MKSVTINITNADSVDHINPIIVKRWLIDSLGVYTIPNTNRSGPGWCIESHTKENQLYWIITFSNDDLATEFALRFL